jgi:hypothetical protein
LNSSNIAQVKKDDSLRSEGSITRAGENSKVSSSSRGFEISQVKNTPTSNTFLKDQMGRSELSLKNEEKSRRPLSGNQRDIGAFEKKDSSRRKNENASTSVSSSNRTETIYEKVMNSVTLSSPKSIELVNNNNPNGGSSSMQPMNLSTKNHQKISENRYNSLDSADFLKEKHQSFIKDVELKIKQRVKGGKYENEDDMKTSSDKDMRSYSQLAREENIQSVIFYHHTHHIYYRTRKLFLSA